jgi:hypothetical protein
MLGTYSHPDRKAVTVEKHPTGKGVVIQHDVGPAHWPKQDEAAHWLALNGFVRDEGQDDEADDTAPVSKGKKGKK